MNEIPIELIKQQEDIINSLERKIVISAGPGSGKTYTIVKKIINEINVIDDYQGIIACSFTKEASKQLSEKISSNCDLKQSFIGTIDSFIMNQIILPFLNRSIIKDNVHIDLTTIKIRIANDIITNQITKNGENASKDEVNEYCHEWKQKLLSGIYTISFASYLYGVHMLCNLKSLCNWISSTYTTIYIDEAQDLNYFQHLFIRKLVNKCELKVVMIGDSNQSIYSFRGARPQLFLNLKNEGYTEYILSYSVRCHQSILQAADAMLNDNYQIIPSNDSRVKIEKFNIELIKSLDENFFILFESNERALKCYNYLKKESMDIIYTIPLELNDKEFEDNYLDIIQESLRFYMNYKNPVSKLVYCIDEYITYLSTFTIKNIQPLDIEKELINPFAFIKYVFKQLDVIIPKNVETDLEEKMKYELILNNYMKYENKNRIFTIHGSKGLEAKNIILLLTMNQYYLSDEYRRKLYVGFSRAKEHLFIIFNNQTINTIVFNYIKNIVDKLKNN